MVAKGNFLRIAFGKYQPMVDAALSDLQAQDVIPRIWAHDHRVWKIDPTEITNRLGWLRITEVMRSELVRLQALARELTAAGFTHALLLGMGGSSLAPEVFSKTFRGRPRGAHLDLSILDSTDPGAVLAHARQLDPARTIYIVSTKSGGTVETFSFFKYFYNQALAVLGPDQVGQHFMAITDPGSRLAQVATDHHFRAIFLNDPNIGGRYSALSFFGLAPAALVGLNLEMLLERAEIMARMCGQQVDNPGALLGAALGKLALAGRDKVTLVISPAVATLGDWIEQLIAESTGKEGKGILPVVGEPLGQPEDYGEDRFFVHLRLRGEDSHGGAIQALVEAGHPCVEILLDDLYDVGGQFFLWEFATAVAGHLLEINPFDQPNVEAAKVLARRMVSEYQEHGVLPVSEAAPLSGQVLEDFLAHAQAGAYIALQVYVQPTPDLDDALLALRTALRRRTRLATSVGYGPRFLHSTGQLHKGDGGRGLFIQITHDPAEDAPIPDEAGSQVAVLNFGILELAQALGDRQALRDAGRQVLHFHMGTQGAGAVRMLAQALS